jgi:hypothetical protein
MRLFENLTKSLFSEVEIYAKQANLQGKIKSYGVHK